MHALKYAAFVFVLTSSFKSNCQTSTKDSVPIIVQQMAAHNIYELSSSVGFTGKLSRQYIHFERLFVLASKEQLLHFARQHPSAVARLYCYQALKKRKIPIPKELGQQMKRDSTKVMTMMGCIADKTSVYSLLDRDVFSSY
jgi:hypothetical protein